MSIVGTVVGVAVMVLVMLIAALTRRGLQNKDVFAGIRNVHARRARRLSVCMGSVAVTLGAKSYVLAGWVSNWNPSVKSTITIGRYCSLNSVSFVLNGDAGHAHNILCSTYHWQCVDRNADRRSSIRIGNDVWIGQDAMIMGGIHVCDGAIVGAGSVVTKDVEPYTIVGGNPAKVLRKRYSPEHIERLLALSWWNWKDAETHAKRLKDEPDIERQIEYMESIDTTKTHTPWMRNVLKSPRPRSRSARNGS